MDLSVSAAYSTPTLTAKRNKAYTQCASHLRSLLDIDERETVLANLAALMHKHREVAFDAIAVCGVSGMLAGQAMAIALKKHLIIVRKESEKRHSTYTLEGGESYASPATQKREFVSHRVALVDDLYDTGATMNWMIEQLIRHKAKHVPVAAFLYNPLPTNEETATYDYQFYQGSVCGANLVDVSIPMFVLPITPFIHETHNL